MNELIFLKLGGSLITDKLKPYTLRQDTIRRIAKEIHEARQEEKIKLIVGHGGGSFPHQSATKYMTNKGIINEESYRGIAIVQKDASKLNKIIVNVFIDRGENAISVQPSSAVLCSNIRIIQWDIEPIKKMLKFNLLPVPYGDVALDLKQGCCIISTEEILTFLAKKMNCKKIILAGKTDGVLDSDGNIIKKITNTNFKKIKKYLKQSDGTDATGGMMHKVERILEFAKYGITSQIINGNIEGNIKKALLGNEKIGTIVERKDNRNRKSIF